MKNYEVTPLNKYGVLLEGFCQPVTKVTKLPGNIVLDQKPYEIKDKDYDNKDYCIDVYDEDDYIDRKVRYDERGTKSKNWVFTLFNFEDIQWYENVDICFIAYGLETCPTTGRKHHQGFLQLHKPKSLGWMKNKLSSTCSFKIMRGNFQQNTNYCSKEGQLITRGEFTSQGKRIDIDEFISSVKGGAPDIMSSAYSKYHAGFDKQIAYWKNKVQFDEAMKEFDEELNDLNEYQLSWLQQPLGKNKCLVVVDPTGGLGKSTFAAYLQFKFEAIVLQNASSKDIAHVYNGQPFVVFDFARRSEEVINYTVIENLMNGTIFSPKYQGGVKIFKKPQVIIFCNFELDWKALSSRKWYIMRYCERELLSIQDGDEEEKLIVREGDCDDEEFVYDWDEY